MKNERTNTEIYIGCFFFPSPEHGTFLHRKPASVGTYCDSCRAKENHKRDTQDNRKKQTALTFSAAVV